MASASGRIEGRCVLCGKTREQVKKLILGVHGGVCLDCVELCNDILRSEGQSTQPKTAEPTHPPTGKVAIVTGASRGIGAAIARRLARDGVAVVVNYNRNAEAAGKLVAEIEARGGAAVAIQADVGVQEQITQMFAQTMERYGRLDILVNNAGVAEFRPLEAIDEADFHRQFIVNVGGVLFATQEAARCIGKEGGRIINITSGAAQAAPPRTSVYSATKAAVQAMTRSHAAELGPRNITVNAVAPGPTETDMLREVIPPEQQRVMIEMTALRRLGTPEDIADVVAFLASEEARWVTGQVIGVSGGLI
ncbi:MAG TPA: glucose 1-dehydrogenase [Chthonomonadaceae bacterium]|nr:glucose 1-dehydrogenase [Chthonomonadaceae bacterium]